MIKKFLIALSFFTRIPLQLNNVSEDDFFSSMLLLPFIGLVIGLLLYGLALLLNFITFKLLTSAILTFFYLYITGSIHFDGVADTCDAIFSSRDRSKVLAIMKDSRLGTFGAISLIVIILFLLIGIDGILYYNKLIILLILPIPSRYCILELACFSQAIPEGGGLGKGFCKVVTPSIVFLYFFIIVISFYLLLPIYILLAFLCVALFTFLEILYFNKKIGGVTGDQFGFTIEVNQVLFLILVLVFLDL